MKIRTKLYVGFGVVLLLTAGIELIDLRSIASLSSEFRHLSADNLQAAVHLSDDEIGHLP